MLENESAYMKLRFSADKKNVLAIRNQNGGSELVFLNKGDLTESRTFPIGDVDAVCFDWNTNINQVLPKN